VSSAPYSWPNALLRRVPSWLQSTVGGKFILGLGDVLGDVVTKTTASIKARFPVDDADPAALSLIGGERRIRRGPQEPATTYARRLRTWWDAHRHRGSAYAMLEQLYACFVDSLDVRMDHVAQSGNRHYVTAGGGIVTHDFISWGGGGPTATYGWAHVWVFFYLDGLVDGILTDAADTLITDGGDRITVSTLFEGVVSDADAEMFRAIPREWKAGHIPYVTVVLLYSTARMWGYPVPVPTWSAWGASGATWGGPVPVILTTDTD